MKLGTIATTAAFLTLGLTSPLLAEDIHNVKRSLDTHQCNKCELTIASANNVNLERSNLRSTERGETLLAGGGVYFSSDNFILGILIGGYYYWDPFYFGYRNVYYGGGYYDPYDSYYGYGYGGGYYRPYYYYRDRYHQGYDYYYSEAEIRQIYRDVLGRDPDYDGLRTWSRERRDGNSWRRIRSEIARSQEAEARINQIYRSVLGRDADPDGLRRWRDRLASGASLGYIRREIENSPEARDLRQRGYRPYRSTTRYSTPERYSPPVNNPTPRRYSTPERYSPPVNNPTPRRYSTPERYSTPRRNIPPASYSVPGGYTPPTRYSSPERYSPPANNPTPRSVRYPSSISAPRVAPERSVPRSIPEASDRRRREYQPFQPSRNYSPPARFSRPSSPIPGAPSGPRIRR